MLHSSDKQKMVHFVSRCLPEGYGRLTLARNAEGDEIIADVTIYGDEIEIVSNCPEWASLREVYDYLRWQNMPAWEQRRWLGLDQTARCQQSGNVLEPYRFKKTGEVWVIHFPSNGIVQQIFFKNHKGLQHYAQLLANPNKTIPSVELAGEANSETLALIESERHYTSMERHDSDSLLAYKKSLGLLHEKRTSAKLSGDLETVESIQSEIDQIECMLSPGRKLGSGLSMKSVGRQLESKSSIALTIHKTVGTAIRRANRFLVDEGLSELAKHLSASVISEGYGYVYRPIAPVPEWSL